MTEKNTPTNKASAKSTDAASKTDNASSATTTDSLSAGASIESADQAQSTTNVAIAAHSETDATPVASNATGDNAAGNNKGSHASGSGNELPDDVVDLVTELRDTVKRLDPRRHTVKTLRRSLSSVRDILGEIDSFL